MSLILIFFSVCYFGRYQSELAELVLLSYSHGRSTHSDRLHGFSVTVPRCYKDIYDSSFLSRIDRLWNSMPADTFL